MKTIIRTLIIGGMSFLFAVLLLTNASAISVDRQPIRTADITITEPYFTDTHSPKVYVSYEYMPLVENVDYKVSFCYNAETDTARAYISGKGLFCSVRVVKFDVEHPGEDLAEYASSSEFIGIPYVWGGTTKNGFDCSGFVQYIYSQFGYSLNRVASDQATQGTWIDNKASLVPGDLVFFSNFGHVGIYIGDNKFVHASNSGIKVSSLESDGSDGSYYETRYCGATRII